LTTSDGTSSSGELVPGSEDQDIVLVPDTEAEAVVEDDEIVVPATAKEGFVKRWTRKVVTWVKKVFRWGSRKTD